jgi:cytochrome c oxidase assembly protein subunit 15
MGCPDWPKCFGSWVPPTQVNQLPDNYRQVYRDNRILKNERLAASLSKMGFYEVANQLVNNPAAYIETEFNATKTWIEYVNRLVGALIGILIFLTLIFSFAYYRHDKAIIYFVFSFFIGWISRLVGFHCGVYQFIAGNYYHSHGCGFGYSWFVDLCYCPFSGGQFKRKIV